MHVHIIITASELVAGGVHSGVISPFSVVQHELVVVIIARNESYCHFGIRAAHRNSFIRPAIPGTSQLYIFRFLSQLGWDWDPDLDLF